MHALSTCSFTWPTIYSHWTTPPSIPYIFSTSNIGYEHTYVSKLHLSCETLGTCLISPTLVISSTYFSGTLKLHWSYFQSYTWKCSHSLLPVSNLLLPHMVYFYFFLFWISLSPAQEIGWQQANSHGCLGHNTLTPLPWRTPSHFSVSSFSVAFSPMIRHSTQMPLKCLPSSWPQLVLNHIGQNTWLHLIHFHICSPLSFTLLLDRARTRDHRLSSLQS